jgi:hypothetical protein
MIDRLFRNPKTTIIGLLVMVVFGLRNNRSIIAIPFFGVRAGI